MTLEHVSELTDKQKEKLREGWTPQEGEYIAISGHEEMIYYLNGVNKSKALPLYSVGQLLEMVQAESGDTKLTMVWTAGRWHVSRAVSASHTDTTDGSDRPDEAGDSDASAAFGTADTHDTTAASAAELCDALWELVKAKL
ncbi:hypothetical protein [Paenibacillus sp. YYML68]|uniref:hypothetical protein n=1 Tax=Paenibacillus sp. YYML68 TaxID=2909250 RepID=UPI002492854E|nr:hypothetical protein [Paenibacillus sp. YYML68]